MSYVAPRRAVLLVHEVHLHSRLWARCPLAALPPPPPRLACNTTPHPPARQDQLLNIPAGQCQAMSPASAQVAHRALRCVHFSAQTTQTSLGTYGPPAAPHTWQHPGTPARPLTWSDSSPAPLCGACLTALSSMRHTMERDESDQVRGLAGYSPSAVKQPRHQHAQHPLCYKD
jgi:hypothetical protein